MPYLLIVPVVAMTALLWLLGRLHGARPGGRCCRAAAAVEPSPPALALVVLTAGAVSASPRAGGVADEREAALSPAGYDGLPLDGDASCRPMPGSWPTPTPTAPSRPSRGRIGIVDGRAVYLEDPAFLAESTALRLGARVVFGTPSAPGAASLPRSRRGDPPAGRDRRPVDGTDLGGYLPFATDVAAIRADPRFRLVREFDDGRLLLFEVVGAGRSRSWLARRHDPDAREGEVAVVLRRAVVRGASAHALAARDRRRGRDGRRLVRRSGPWPASTAGPTCCGSSRPVPWRSSRRMSGLVVFVATSVFFEPDSLARTLAPRELVVLPLALGVAHPDRRRPVPLAARAWRSGSALLLVARDGARRRAHVPRSSTQDFQWHAAQSWIGNMLAPVILLIAAAWTARDGRPARARRRGRGRRSWRPSSA